MPLSLLTRLLPVTDEETTEYSRIIDGILAAADLQTVTRKKIRQGLEAAIEKDLSDQKVRLLLVPAQKLALVSNFVPLH